MDKTTFRLIGLKLEQSTLFSPLLPRSNTTNSADYENIKEGQKIILPTFIQTWRLGPMTNKKSQDAVHDWSTHKGTGHP